MILKIAKTALILFTIKAPLGFSQENYTLKTYEQIRSQKPEIDEPNVRVWSIRKTPIIRINLVESKGELPLHKHPDADHSLLVLEGKVQVQIANDKFVVNKGDFISVPANVPHKYWTLSKKAVLVSMDAPYYDGKKTIRLDEPPLKEIK